MVEGGLNGALLGAEQFEGAGGLAHEVGGGVGDSEYADGAGEDDDGDGDLRGLLVAEEAHGGTGHGDAGASGEAADGQVATAQGADDDARTFGGGNELLSGELAGERGGYAGVVAKVRWCVRGVEQDLGDDAGAVNGAGQAVGGAECEQRAGVGEDGRCDQEGEDGERVVVAHHAYVHA